MAAATQVFAASDCVRYKRLHVLEKAGQRVLAYTLRCGTPYKSGPVHLDQYLANLPEDSTARYKKMNGKQRRDCFNNTDTGNISADPSWDTFDVTLLYKAITCSCEGWQDQDGLTLRLAQNVKEIKDTRNAVVHETFTTVSEQDFLTELSHLRTLLHSILEATKDKYNTDDSECNAMKNDANKIIDGIQQERLSIREIQQRATADLLPSFKSEADEELRRALERNTFIDPLHFLSQHESDRVEALKVFKPVTITENIRGDTLTVEPFKMLSHTQSGSPRLILVEGDAGSGKTTLLTYTVCEYLKEESERRMEGLHQYDLLLRVVCREEMSRTLQTLLLERLLPCAFYKYGRLVMPLVRHSRVLVLIDGLDEQHDDSRHLVRDILNQGKDWPSLTLLATSRPEALQTMKANTPREFKVSHLRLEGVSPDQRTQLALQYHEWLCADVPQSDARLRQVMEEIGWKELFRLPLNIVFLVKIVNEGSDGMIVCESKLYQKILNWCVEKLKVRLLGQGASPTLLDANIDTIFRECCKISYTALIQDNIYLNPKEVLKITECSKKCELPETEILAAFYSQRREVVAGVTKTRYYAPHKGLQDFMAARHIIESLPHKYKEGDILCILQRSKQGEQVQVSPLRNMFGHLLGLLSQNGDDMTKAMKETVGLIQQCGVSNTRDWLNLLADTKVNNQILETVAQTCSEEESVTITDGTVDIATALLPLIKTTKSIKLQLHREPREIKSFFVALGHHKIYDIRLMHHYPRPRSGVYSDHWLRLAHKSDLREFWGHLDAEHLALLPRGLEWLYVSVASGDHAKRFIPSLASLRKNCPELEELRVNLSLSAITSPPSTSLPGGGYGVRLYLSDMGDGQVDLACDIAVALSPSDGRGYRGLWFPRAASLRVDGWTRLIEHLASRKVRVGAWGVNISSHTLTQDEEHQLDTLTQSLLGCWFGRYDFRSEFR